jgi:MoaA/NifB/PqqE/SkfB family radical SAM enzyme
VFCSENTDQSKTNGILPSIEMINKVFYHVNKSNGINRKINNIYLAGGEPTLREDLCDIITIAAKHANAVHISTHGDYDNTEKLAKEIKICGITNVAISLHGHDALTHDRTTRIPGSFVRTINSIIAFLENNLTVNINCVVTNFNIDKIKNVVEFIANNFSLIKHLTFSHYRQHGEACEHKHLMFNPWDHTSQITEAINEAEQKNLKIKFRDFPFCIEPRIKLLNSKVAKIYVVIWKSLKKFELLSEESNKNLLPRCSQCSENDCFGYLTANLENYDKYSAWKKM